MIEHAELCLTTVTLDYIVIFQVLNKISPHDGAGVHPSSKIRLDLDSIAYENSIEVIKYFKFSGLYSFFVAQYLGSCYSV